MEVTYLACINLQQFMVGITKFVVKLTPQNLSTYFNTVLFLQKPPHDAATKGVATSKIEESYALISLTHW